MWRGVRYAGCATFFDPSVTIRHEMQSAARRVDELLRAEVGFRGAFTIDGVATAQGFLPAELNPRNGAGLVAAEREFREATIDEISDVTMTVGPALGGSRR